MTLGQIAEEFALAPWKVTRLCDLGRIVPAARVGSYRCFRRDQLPDVRAALEKAGYLKGAVPA